VGPRDCGCLVSAEEAGIRLHIGAGARATLGLKRDKEGPICDMWQPAVGRTRAPLLQRLRPPTTCQSGLLAPA
jgi:hypothetical protein